MRIHKPFKGNVAYEWQINCHVFQFCHNDKWNWQDYATCWRFNYFNCRKYYG